MNIFGNNNYHERLAKLIYSLGICLALTFAFSITSGVVHAASSVPELGSAANFALLGGTDVVCTDSTVTGNIGVYPGNAVTQTNCTTTGTVHMGDTTAAAAYTDFLSAYDALAVIPCDVVLTGTLDSVTLAPGVYCFDAAATLTGQLTLDGPTNGTWIFKVGTSGTGALTGTNFSVVMSGNAEPCNVYWWVAEAATLTDSNFVGTILAGTSITVTRGTFSGDAFAKAAVTITGVTLVGCEGNHSHGNSGQACNQGVGNGPEGCDPGNSNQGDPDGSNDENGGTPGNPGRGNDKNSGRGNPD